jgi:hypothetical protein
MSEQTRQPEDIEPEDIEAGPEQEDETLEIESSLQELTPQEILTIASVLRTWV